MVPLAQYSAQGTSSTLELYSESALKEALSDNAKVLFGLAISNIASGDY